MSRDTEDNGNRTSQSKPDNPFIKFRQFADEQISSLLQGMVGIPSAFSKTSGRARWAEFDEELRRRDELLSRQNKLKDWEAGKVGQDTKEDLPERYSNLTQTSPTSAGTVRDSDVKYGVTVRDLPLYSSISNTLFAHLWQPDDGRSWSQFSPAIQKLWTRQFTWGSESDARMMNKYIRIYHDLMGSPYPGTEGSLLPYLLFSSYSPLKLTEDDLSNRPTGDPFPYMDAFEDLISVSHGGALQRTGCSDLWSSRLKMSSPQQFSSNASDYIHQLGQKNLLQQQESPNGPSLDWSRFQGVDTREVGKSEEGRPDILDDVFELFVQFFGNGSLKSENIFDFGSPIADAERGVLKDTKDTNSASERGPGEEDTQSGAPQTEDEMYERFLRIVSPTTGNSGGTIRGPSFVDMDNTILQEIFRPDSKRTTKWIKIAHDLSAKQPGEKIITSQLAADFIRDFFLPALDKEETHTPERPSPESGAPRLISTSTTTESIAKDNGSVESRVTIRERYSDGSENIRTNSREGALGDTVLFHDSETNIQKPKKEIEEETKKESEKPTKKGGWFWN